VFFLNLATENLGQVSPPWSVSPCPLLTPSDATGLGYMTTSVDQLGLVELIGASSKLQRSNVKASPRWFRSVSTEQCMHWTVSPPLRSRLDDVHFTLVNNIRPLDQTP